MTFDIFLTIFLVLLNGFFVAAEFAIVKVRSSQIALEKGNMASDAAKTIINNLDGFLAATQLGITLASLGLGWVGEDVVSRLVMNLIHFIGFDITETTASQRLHQEENNRFTWRLYQRAHMTRHGYKRPHDMSVASCNRYRIKRVQRIGVSLPLHQEL